MYYMYICVNVLYNTYGYGYGYGILFNVGRMYELCIYVRIYLYMLIFHFFADKKRKSKWDQSGPGSSGTSPSAVGSQARINAQLQADLQRLLNKK